VRELGVRDGFRGELRLQFRARIDALRDQVVRRLRLAHAPLLVSLARVNL